VQAPAGVVLPVKATRVRIPDPAVEYVRVLKVDRCLYIEGLPDPEPVEVITEELTAEESAQ